MNLDDFISMSPKIGEGCIKDIDGFIKYFENDVTAETWCQKKKKKMF